MSIAIMILGDSGTGKSTSLRNIDPAKALLIQSISKPLPFKNTWRTITEEDKTGSVWVNDKSASIVKAMQRTNREIIIIDDFQYTMSNEFMRRVEDKETGNQAFAKYNEIAKGAWDILKTATELPAHKRVYFLSHTQTDDVGQTKIKTIGKLLDEKIVLEGMVTIVLKSQRINGNYVFSTQNNGNDTVKSPMGMFDEELIDNDLAMIDSKIIDYYELSQPVA